MDESTRKLERESFEGDPHATLRLAQWQLRSGQPEEALATLAGEEGPAVFALKAEILLGDGQLGAAADAAGDALQLDAGVVDTELRERLIDRLWEFLELPSSQEPLPRCQTLRRLAVLDGISDPPVPDDLLGRAQYAHAPIWRSSALKDPRPLVRAIGRGAYGTALYPDEAVPRRLFSAHGGDFESGTLVAFETSCEDRLTYFDQELFDAVNSALGPGDRYPAFGRGYGLAIPSGDPTGDLDERVAAVNAARILPFPLVVHTHQPFDRLVNDKPDGDLGAFDALLARRFHQDLRTHPARMNNPGDTVVFHRILGAYRSGNPERSVISALFVEARELYGPVGLRALELFRERVHAENERMAARKAQKKAQKEAQQEP